MATPRNYRLGPGDEVIIDIYGAAQQTTPQEKELPAPERDVVREGWVGMEKGV